jgi:hypothetical protein
MARLGIVTSLIGRADNIFSVPVSGNVRANTIYDGQQVSGDREVGFGSRPV